MAAAWLAAAKTVLPYLEPILQVVVPAFTRKKADAVAAQVDLLNQQIAELQAASSENAERIKVLAEQLKTIVEALDQAGATAASAHESLRKLCSIAVGASLVSLALVVMSWIAR